MLPSGSYITWQWKAPTTLGNNSASSLEAAVASELTAQSLSVVDFSVVAPSLGVEIANIWGYVVQVTMKIKTRTDFGAPEDVQAIGNHAVYVVTGALPSASALIKVETPAGDTSAPDPAEDVSAADNSQAASWWDKFTAGLQGAGIGAFLGIGLALAAVVIIVSALTARKAMG